MNHGMGVAALACVLSARTLTAHAGTIYVDAARPQGSGDGATWDTAFGGRTGLQSALALAQAGDEIWVADGVYAPGLNGAPRTVTFTLKDGVRVLGGFAGGETNADERDPSAHVAVLTGDLASNGNDWPFAGENALRVVTAVNLNATAELDGFTVTGGVNDQADNFEQYGGGMVISGGAMTVRRCTFVENMAGWLGGGLGIVDAAPLVEDCVFAGNRGHAGCNAAQRRSHATFRGCSFVGDSHVTGGTFGVGIMSGPPIPNGDDASHLTVEDCFFSIDENEFSCPTGMGIYLSAGSADIRRTDFINNVSCGGGTGVSGDAVVTIDRCRFIGNEGFFDGGAAIHSFAGDYTVTNSLFHANDKKGFSTIFAGGRFRAVNCTFTNNGEAAHFHYAIIGFGDVSLENCVVWGNQSLGGDAEAVAFLGSGGVPRFDRCLVQAWDGRYPGDHSFAADPLFVDVNGADNVAGTLDDDLSLGDGSPAIDRGRNAALTETGQGLGGDLVGSPRFRDDPDAPDLGVGAPPLVDLGALERLAACAADVNGDGFVNGDDYDLFAGAFDAADQAADLNGDGFVNGDDYDFFAEHFEEGC
ncbi:MAG: right-handed parallel beta-helix repeat-containing protein [Phycisphaerae bacterium]|nr:right-handed parallel beta-helix repeat-containing protein [Phycisphaerae bacterium]